MSKAKINLSIHAPDTTIIHRAGILGLWMTLKQLEREFPEPKNRLGEISWILTNHSISIHWQGEDLDVLEWLLKQSFRLTDQGIIKFTGLQRKPIPLENQIHLHQTILATLLQYNGSVQALQKSYFKSINIQVKDIKLRLSYKPLTSYFYQNFASKLCDKKTRQLRQNQYIPIVSRLYPGAIIQHSLIGSKNQCREKMEYAFALLFLPIASQFLTLSQEIKKQISSEKSYPTEYLIIIPEPTNLENDANIRWDNIDEDFSNLYVSSLAEGVLSYYKKIDSESDNDYQCQVITYGKIIHGSKMRGVIDNQDYLVEANMIKQYRLLDINFKPNQILPTNKNFLVRINLIKGIIANNLLSKQPIWKNLWLIIRDQDSYGEIREALKYNRQGLLSMIKNSQEITEAHNAFIDIIHETLRNIYAQIYANYKENRKLALKKIDQENERLKSNLLNCYKEDTFRHLLAKLFSRARNLKTLEQNRLLVLPILTGKQDWQESRDIALIALSSYPATQKIELDSDDVLFFIFPLLIDEKLYTLAFLLL